jgi:hypothetical protein
MMQRMVVTSSETQLPSPDARVAGDAAAAAWEREQQQQQQARLYRSPYGQQGTEGAQTGADRNWDSFTHRDCRDKEFGWL